MQKESLLLAIAISLSVTSAAIARSPKSKIPLPPVVMLPLAQIEPNRDVPAEQWHSPYCLRWNDGCRECQREKIGTTVTCRSLDPGKTECKASFSICAKPDVIGLQTICGGGNFKFMQRSEFDRSQETGDQFLKRSNGGAGYPSLNWYYDKGRWLPFLKDYTEVPAADPGYLNAGFVCRAGFTKEDIAEMMLQARRSLVPIWANRKLADDRFAHGDQIDYFSSDGAELAKRWHIPRPPIEVLSLGTVDPPRNRLATDWKGQFCAAWSDGCTDCERDAKSGSVACAKIQQASPGAECRPHDVWCGRLIRPFERAFTECQNIDNPTIYHLKDGTHTEMEQGEDVYWVYSKKGWDFELHDGGDLPPGPTVSTEEKNFCTKTFLKEHDGSSGVFVATQKREDRPLRRP